MAQTRMQPDLQLLLSTDFLGRHTNYPTIQALLQALAGSFGNRHKLIKQWELDFFIRTRTPYASWSDLTEHAKLCYPKRAA